ncbi:MAG: hypothetical protein ACE5F1_18450 [Planctomycetota bacterium]
MAKTGVPKKARKKLPARKKAQKKAAKKQAGGKKKLRKGPATEVTTEVLEFINALDNFKKSQNRPFPTWSEVLQVLKDLGYRKVRAGDDPLD